MNAAINTLRIALDTLRTNEPINRAEGNIAQADIEADNAAELADAIQFLTDRDK